MQKIIQLIINALVTALIERVGKPVVDLIKRAASRKKTDEAQKEKLQKVKEAKDEDTFNKSVDDL